MNMDEILSKVDHTLLKQDATWEDVRALINDAIKYNTASVCIAPSFVGLAKSYIIAKNSDVKVCTVIGFPNGYNTTEVKCQEASDAVLNGADEIDMVVNIGWIKAGDYEDVLKEINAVKDACKGKLLKVIIETALLTEEEKIKMCEIVSESKAEYIKTSTGFSKGGATFEDVELMAKYVSNDTKIKAAGGISSIEDAKRFIELGASRLGTSRIVKLVKEME